MTSPATQPKDAPSPPSERSCPHGDLEYLGSQSVEAGANQYFRCKACRAVIVVPPASDVVYEVPGVKEKSEGGA